MELEYAGQEQRDATVDKWTDFRTHKLRVPCNRKAYGSAWPNFLWSDLPCNGRSHTPGTAILWANKEFG